MRYHEALRATPTRYDWSLTVHSKPARCWCGRAGSAWGGVSGWAARRRPRRADTPDHSEVLGQIDRSRATAAPVQRKNCRISTASPGVSFDVPTSNASVVDDRAGDRADGPIRHLNKPVAARGCFVTGNAGHCPRVSRRHLHHRRSVFGAESSAQCLGRSVLVGIHSDGCPRAQPLPGGRQAMTGNLREWCSGGMFLACFLQIAGCDRMRLR